VTLIQHDRRDVFQFIFVKNLEESFTVDVYHLLEDTQTLPLSRNFVPSRRIIVLFGTSLSGYALLNASRTAQTISTRSNVREWTHVLLVNTPRSHQNTSCTTGVSRGLVTKVTLTRVSRGRLEESITWEWTWFHCCTVVRSTWLVMDCVLNGTPCSKREEMKRLTSAYCKPKFETKSQWAELLDASTKLIILIIILCCYA
jgi:hypothetical protein